MYNLVADITRKMNGMMDCKICGDIERQWKYP